MSTVTGRPQSTGEEIANSVSHGVGLIALAIAAPFLIVAAARDGTAANIVGASVFVGTIAALYLASTLYHALPRPRVKRVFRVLDHNAIYLLIAGTYTPICVHFFTGFWREGMLVLIWALALIGITVKLLILRGPRWLTAGIYLVMGWLAVAAIGEMLRVMPLGAVLLLGLGGLFFSLGAVIYIAKRPDFAPGVFGFHELWHGFVILGCLSHYLLIAVFVAAAAQ